MYTVLFIIFGVLEALGIDTKKAPLAGGVCECKNNQPIEGATRATGVDSVDARSKGKL